MSTWKSIVPYLQVSLGVWQILKFTPLVGIIQGLMEWLLWPLFPGFFKSYALLRGFPGRVFKQVKYVELTSSNVELTSSKGEQASNVQQPISNNTSKGTDSPVGDTLSMWYLGEKFTLKKKDENKLFVNDEMSHYISCRHWQRIDKLNKRCLIDEEMLTDSESKLNKPVFVEGYRNYWEKTFLGNVMTFDQVLDRFICEQTGLWISHDVDFLPVDLTKQSEIISKILNLVGLFFQAKKNKFPWYYPTFFTIASAVLERPLISLGIKKVFIWSVQCVCDKLPYSMRRFVYSLDMWVDNLKPCNDIQLRVVRGNIDLVIGGAAKINEQYLTPLQCVPWLSNEETTENPKTIRCGRSIDFEAEYDSEDEQCKVTLTHKKGKTKDMRLYVDCKGTTEFKKICHFLSYVAKTKAGSLKSYDQKKKKVVVRSWRESVRHYVAAGLPDLYTLTLYDVTM